MGLLISLIFLFVNLATNSHYGFTWDLPHHFNAGLRHLGLPPLDASFGTQPYGPIADTLPVLGWLLFYKNLHLLPPDEAYHLLLIVAGALGIYIIYKITKEMFGSIIALFSATFLALYPRYIGHIHNNMKDSLSAVAIAFAVWMFIKFFKSYSSNPAKQDEKSITITVVLAELSSARTITLLFSFLSVAIAFNTKINALLLVPILSLWLLLGFRDQIRLKLPKFWLSSIGNIKFSYLLIYTLLSLFLSLMLWFLFWPNPVFQLTELFRHFSSTLHGFNVLYFGKIYYVGINTPWHYALGFLLAVTPFLMLIFVFLGLIKLILDTVSLKNRYSALVLTWFFVPTLKYLNPNIGVFDDIRHFLEAVFPLCIMAGIGAEIIYRRIIILINYSSSPASRGEKFHNINIVLDLLRRFRTIINKRVVFLAFYLTIIFYLLLQIIPIHPYETAYFSEIVGGVKGASGKFDLEFWGNALKEGSLYLNKTAPINSVVSVPMAQHVAREYLRPDITVVQYATPTTNYLMFFNRESFLKMYRENDILNWYLANQKPVFTIERAGAVLLWIYEYD